MSWLDPADEDRIFLSVVSLAEICFEVERLAPGLRRNRLDLWLRDELPARFEGRVVPVDKQVADACGRLLGRARGGAGRGLGAMDAVIAAICLASYLALATRNTGDFDGLGLELFAP